MFGNVIFGELGINDQSLLVPFVVAGEMGGFNVQGLAQLMHIHKPFAYNSNIGCLSLSIMFIFCNNI